MVDKMPIYSEIGNFYIEANPDQSGVRILLDVPKGAVWICTIIDDGDNFCFSSRIPEGFIIRKMPLTKHKLKTSDGKDPSLKYKNQLEVDTPYRRMYARPIDPKDLAKGVAVFYSYGTTLWSIARCQSENGVLTIDFEY
jgi:hypothetical protein